MACSSTPSISQLSWASTQVSASSSSVPLMRRTILRRCRESCVVRKGIHGEALIVVREEYTDQFGDAAITAHGRANVRKRHLTAKISHHPGNAGVLLVNSVLVGDVPDVQAQVLHVAELNTSLVLREDLDDIVQDRGLLILK